MHEFAHQALTRKIDIGAKILNITTSDPHTQSIQQFPSTTSQDGE
jgi:hypothetical protein